MLEREIEEEILDWLETLGPDMSATKIATVGFFDTKRKVFRKPRSKYQKKGVSDIVATYKGRSICIEVKSKRGIIRPEQRKWLEDQSRAGALCMVARSLDEVKEAFREHLFIP